MGQVASKLRRATGMYQHWCPACEEMHPLPDSWKFNGNLESPTFHPSFAHSGYSSHHQPRVCHYFLTDGVLIFQADCTHRMKGVRVTLPDLPAELRDDQVNL